ncbi:hypothetical protein [Belnapia sp. F-4-1]|uniref:hypothetical protein n=1 Tax=Belnapia sp. F-4-1 TaxID=1545443 RepID=UPI000A6C8A52|nr:hypothetical protein [Belnapia sp. F-4-1]
MADDQTSTPVPGTLVRRSRSGSMFSGQPVRKPGWRRGLPVRLRPGLEAGLVLPGSSDRSPKTMRVAA